MMNKAIVWSAYQLEIFRWVMFGTGHALIEATAGSGKTTVLVEAARRICVDNPHARILYLAFNKRLQLEAEAKFKELGPQITVKTLHSQGFGQLSASLKASGRGVPKINRNKVVVLARKRIRACIPEEAWLTSSTLRQQAKTSVSALARWMVRAYPERHAYHTARLVRQYMEHVRLRCIGGANEGAFFDAIYEMARREGIFVPNGRGSQHAFGKLVLEVFQDSLWSANEDVDFTDMLFVPAYLGLDPDAHYNWVLVDEAQDLGLASIRLLETLVWPPPYTNGTRLLAVGDPNQAIYGFAGADRNAFERLAERFEATRLPLTVSYRCPEVHVRLCRRVVPQMEVRPGADQGRLWTCDESAFVKVVRPGDLVVARCNAPLIRMCLHLLQKGIAAIMRGRDVSKMLLSFAREAHEFFSSQGLCDALSTYASFLQEQILSNNQDVDEDDPRLQRIDDTHDAVQVVLSTLPQGLSNRALLDALRAKLQEIFKARESAVSLSTVHRAKGFEAENVFVLRPDQLPMRWRRQTPEELRQEWCAVFVAASRAKHSLCVVRGDDACVAADDFWNFDRLLVANDSLEALELEAQNTDAPANDDVGRYSFEAPPGHVP